VAEIPYLVQFVACSIAEKVPEPVAVAADIAAAEPFVGWAVVAVQAVAVRAVAVQAATAFAWPEFAAELRPIVVA